MNSVSKFGEPIEIENQQSLHLQKQQSAKQRIPRNKGVQSAGKPNGGRTKKRAKLNPENSNVEVTAKEGDGTNAGSLTVKLPMNFNDIISSGGKETDEEDCAGQKINQIIPFHQHMDSQNHLMD